MMKFSLICVPVLFLTHLSYADAVRLQVKGPNGQPVAGAKVRVVESKLDARYDDSSAPRDFVANAQGIVALTSQGVLFKANDRDSNNKSLLTARILSPNLAAKIVTLNAGNNVITLVKGQTLDGITLDANSKPVPNVRLALFSARSDDNFVWMPNALKLETRSDAQGRWKVAGVPLTGKGSIQVKDPRFKNESFALDFKLKAPPLFLEPGAGVKGRLLKPDGTPAKGIQLSIDGLSVMTDANGRFEMRGLTRPFAYVQLLNEAQNLTFIVQPRSLSDLQVGQVRNLGDWKTVQGVFIKGRVVDAQTQKPVANARINGRVGNIWRDVTSDEKGEFAVITTPGTFNLSVRASGFARASKKGTALDKKGVDVGAIALKKGSTASGVTVDEAGKPVSVYLYVNRGGNREYIQTNEKDGKFIIDSLVPGKHTLTAYQAKIISGATFTLGKGASSPLRIVVRKNEGSSTESRQKQSVLGRVLDSDGKPVAGAKILLSVRGERSSYQSLYALSQSDGSFTARTFTSKVRIGVLRVARPGYVRGGERVETKADGWHVDLTLQKRGQVLRGRVVDTQGRGVAGAFVGVQSDDNLPVAADEKGNFALLDAPQSRVTLLASNGPSLGTFALEKAGQPIEIVLPDSPQISREEMADSILPKASLEYEWNNNWEILGSKRIEALILKGTGDRGGNDWLWTQYLEELARREPRTFIGRESTLQATTNVTGQEGFQRLRMLARAKTGDAAQKAEVKAWLEEEEKSRLDLSMPSVLQLLSIAEVAARLDPKQGALWLEYADQIMGQLDFKRGGDSVWTLGRLAARVSPGAAQKLGQEWTVPGQMEILLIAMRTWNDDGNLKAMQIGWKQLNALSAKLPKNPAPKPRRREYVYNPSDIIKQAQGYYAMTLAKTDVKAALDMVLKLKDTDYSKRVYLLSVARLAVRAKQYDVARTALKAMNSTARSGSVSPLEVAEITQSFDPSLAKTLWSREFSKSRSDFVDEWRQQNRSDITYAKTRARVWPGESRILLEREWKRRFESLPKKNIVQPEYYYEYGTSSPAALVEATALVAPQRALEIVDSLPQSENYKSRLRLKVVLALLQPKS